MKVWIVIRHVPDNSGPFVHTWPEAVFGLRESAQYYVWNSGLRAEQYKDKDWLEIHEYEVKL